MFSAKDIIPEKYRDLFIKIDKLSTEVAIQLCREMICSSLYDSRDLRLSNLKSEIIELREELFHELKVSHQCNKKYHHSLNLEEKPQSSVETKNDKESIRLFIKEKMTNYVALIQKSTEGCTQQFIDLLENKDTKIFPEGLQTESIKLLKTLKLLKCNSPTLTKVTIDFHNYILETNNEEIDFDSILTRCLLETQCPIDTILIHGTYLRSSGLDRMLAILKVAGRPIKAMEFYDKFLNRFEDAYFLEDVITQHEIQHLEFKSCYFYALKPINNMACIPRPYNDEVCFQVNDRRYSEESNLAIQGIAYGLVSMKSKIKKISFYASWFHGKEIEILKSALELIKVNDEKAKIAFVRGFSCKQSSLRTTAESAIFDRNAIKLIFSYFNTSAVIENERDFVILNFQPAQKISLSKKSCALFARTSQTCPIEFAKKWHPVFTKILNAEAEKTTQHYKIVFALIRMRDAMQRFNPANFSIQDLCELEKITLFEKDKLQSACLNESVPSIEDVQRVKFSEKLYEGIKILKNLMNIPDLNDRKTIFKI